MDLHFGGQMFFRKAYGFKNLYLVCGLVRSDTFIENGGILPDEESIYLVSGTTVGKPEDVSKVSRGNDLDGVIRSKLWRVRDN